MKKLLTLSLIALTAFIGCKKAAEDDVFDPLKDKDNPQEETKASITTEKLYVSATEASFAWSEYNGNAEQDFEGKRAELLAPILEKIQNAINVVGKEKGYTYVLDLATGAAVYVGTDAVDCTSAVKAKLGITK